MKPNDAEILRLARDDFGDRPTRDGSALARRFSTAGGVFALVFVLGIALRAAAAFYSLGFVHPDEHQQYLEAAQGIAHGYNVEYWEYRRGVRHYLYPGLLAGLLKVFDGVGFEDPVGQAVAIRFLLAAAIHGALALVAAKWLRQGRAAASLCLVAIGGFSPDMIYVSVRTLSETAMLVPLILALLFFFWERNRFLAGVFLGLSFAVRFQAVFFILPAVGIDLWEGFRAEGDRGRLLARPLLVGLGLSVLALGAIDKVTWGGWFHSPLANFSANLLEGKAASFGTSPWHRYAGWSLWALLDAGIVVLPMLSIGVCRAPQLAWFVAVFFVGHSAIGHKEARFLWPLLPILLMLAAIGFEWLWGRLEGKGPRATGLLVMAAMLLPGVYFRFESLDWRLEPTRSVSLALAKAGRLDDLCGLAVFGLSDWSCGNYFFLRRNVPYLAIARGGESVLREDPLWKRGVLNYLVTKPEYLDALGPPSVEQVDGVGEWAVYRVRSAAPGARRSAADSPKNGA